MSTVINFNSETSKEANKFDALPEDRYTVVVEEAVLAPTKAGGEMIKVTFVVDEGKSKGRKLWHQFPIGAKSNIFLFNFLKTINSPLVTKDGVSVTEIANSLKGTRVSVYAEPSVTQNGNATNKLSKFQPVSGGTTSNEAAAPKKALFS